MRSARSCERLNVVYARTTVIVEAYSTKPFRSGKKAHIHETDSSALKFSATLLNVLSCHAGAKKNIPVNEPGLREIRLDADSLMMDIVVIGCVAAYHLEWVEREVIPAVVVDCLAGGEDEEKQRLAN
jgi:hypothetical protein